MRMFLSGTCSIKWHVAVYHSARHSMVVSPEQAWILLGRLQQMLTTVHFPTTPPPGVKGWPELRRGGTGEIRYLQSPLTDGRVRTYILRTNPVTVVFATIRECHIHCLPSWSTLVFSQFAKPLFMCMRIWIIQVSGWRLQKEQESVCKTRSFLDTVIFSPPRSWLLVALALTGQRVSDHDKDQSGPNAIRTEGRSIDLFQESVTKDGLISTARWLSYRYLEAQEAPDPGR